MDREWWKGNLQLIEDGGLKLSVVSRPSFIAFQIF